MNKPKYLGIGCRRCASSWLHSLLNSHPQISKPKNGLHYFSQDKVTSDEYYSYFNNHQTINKKCIEEILSIIIE